MNEENIISIYDAAPLLFISAKEAAKRAHKMEGRIGQQNDVITAIVLCVVIAEAGINEIGEWFEKNHLRPPFSIPHGLPYGFERLELRVKWSLLPIIVRQRTFDKGAEPWQSFNALVEMRNSIVHLRSRQLSKSATALLKAKKLAKGNYLSFEVAQWACETISAMFENLTELVDPPQKWMGLLWRWTQVQFPRGLSTPGDPWK